MANKLKSALAGLGEILSPSIKKERLASEANTAATDKAIQNIVRKRKMRKRKQNPKLHEIPLTPGEKDKLFQGPPVNASERARQVQEIIKNRKTE